MKIVIVDKTGTVKTHNVKNFEIATLYKKCLFRKSDDFHKRHCWTVKIKKKTYNVALFAKHKGKATTENKYDLPPPVDKVIYYGSMALVNFNVKDGDETDVTDFTSKEWEKIYEKLFGGFEDIADTDDEEEEDELANVPKKYLTKKGGYLKDGFVVDTASEEDTDESSENKQVSKLENTVIKIKTNNTKEDKLDDQNCGSDDSDAESSDVDDDILVISGNDPDNEEEIQDIGDDDGGDDEDDDEDDEDDDEDAHKDNSNIAGHDEEDDDESYIAESDSEESDNSSELSESAYCEYSDED